MTFDAETRHELADLREAGRAGREKLYDKIDELRRDQNDALSKLHSDCLTPMKTALGIIASKFKDGEVMTRSRCFELQQRCVEKQGQILAAVRAPGRNGNGCGPPRKRKPIEIIAGIGAIVVGAIIGITGLVQIICVLVGRIRAVVP